ncbi:MAG: cupredoxin domain-containing protein [Chloroflexota bacterium]
MKKLIALFTLIIILTACGPAEPEPISISLKALDIAWETPDLTAAAGQTITLEVINTGVLDHTFTIEELALDLEVSPDESIEITFMVSELGTYDFICTTAGHAEAGMVGTLTITP